MESLLPWHCNETWPHPAPKAPEELAIPEAGKDSKQLLKAHPEDEIFELRFPSQGHCEIDPEDVFRTGRKPQAESGSQGSDPTRVHSERSRPGPHPPHIQKGSYADIQKARGG